MGLDAREVVAALRAKVGLDLQPVFKHAAAVGARWFAEPDGFQAGRADDACPLGWGGGWCEGDGRFVGHVGCTGVAETGCSR